MNLRQKTITSWTVVTIVLGTMMSLQYHDVLLGGSAIWSSLPDVAAVSGKLQAVTEYNQSLQKRIRGIDRQMIGLQNRTLSRGGAVAALERRMHSDRVLLGTVPLVGPGVVITISDGRMSANDQEQFLTHDWDLRSVVNELFLAGADAVAINQARITQSTGVFCIGPVVRVGTTRLSSPFVIRAIGDPTVLAAALAMPGGVLDALRGANRGLIVVQPSKRKLIHLPAFTAPYIAGKGGING